ncbi:hypothetical protein ACFOZ1_15225 [Gracilibacillus marinus]|uniref:Uncharacterized protein n=1 Tax=Gracilibacillus marinus TaxID=630535 RepID=A0ABV8VX71_9BACI
MQTIVCRMKFNHACFI